MDPRVYFLNQCQNGPPGFFLNPTASHKNKLLIALVLGAIGLLILLACGMLFVFPQRQNSNGFAILISATIVFAGWAIRIPFDRQLQRRRQTFDVLTQSLTSDTYYRHIINIRRHFAFNHRPSAEEARQIQDERKSQWDHISINADGALKGDIPVGFSIIFLLSYYEYVCSSIYHGEIDEKILYSGLGGVIIGLHDQFEEILKTYGPDSEYYVYLRMYVAKWKKKRPLKISVSYDVPNLR